MTQEGIASAPQGQQVSTAGHRARRSYRALLSLAATAVLLSGCAVRYGPRVPGLQPGYEEQRLGEATYQVRIGEAWPKDWPDLEKFAMYRAAEVAESRGFDFFEVLAASSQVNSYAVATPATATTTGTAFGAGGSVMYSATTTVTPGASGSIQGGWYTLEFRLLDPAQAQKALRVVDARQVRKDLAYFIESRR